MNTTADKEIAELEAAKEAKRKELEAIDEKLRAKQLESLNSLKTEIISKIDEYSRRSGLSPDKVFAECYPEASKKTQTKAKPRVGGTVKTYRVPGKDVYFAGAGGLDKMSEEMKEAIRASAEGKLEQFLNPEHPKAGNKAWSKGKIETLKKWKASL
jgi:hypothetical protein